LGHKPVSSAWGYDTHTHACVAFKFQFPLLIVFYKFNKMKNAQNIVVKELTEIQKEYIQDKRGKRSKL
jgi:hypothetical protein